MSWVGFLSFSTRVLINIYIRQKKAGCKTVCNNKIQIFILKTRFLLCMFRKYTGSTLPQIVNDCFGVAGKLVVCIFSFLPTLFSNVSMIKIWCNIVKNQKSNWKIKSKDLGRVLFSCLYLLHFADFNPQTILHLYNNNEF